MGCKILKRVNWPWLRPFQGRFFICRVGLAMVSQSTKFQISRFTRYKAMNGGAKCRKLGGLGWLIETMRLSCIVFEIYPIICQKTPILIHPACIRRPHNGWSTPVEFRGDLWHQKTRLPGLSCAGVCLMLHLSVLIEHRLVTDRHGQTQAHG